MTKRFMVFLMVLVLGISMVSVALADDSGGGGTCTHPQKTTEIKSAYSNADSSTHLVTETKVTSCATCKAVLGASVVAQYRKAHTEGSTKYDYHTTGDKHVFYKMCVYCRYHTQEVSTYCPGSPHVNIVLSVPGGTVAE